MDNKMTAEQAMEWLESLHTTMSGTASITQEKWPEAQAAAKAFRAALSAPRVPAGWKLVPDEPTSEMVHKAMLALEAWRCSAQPMENGSNGLRRAYTAMLAASPEPASEQPIEQPCKRCGGKTMHVGDVCYSCSHPPEPVAQAEKVHAVSLVSEVPGHEKRGVIGHYKIHHNGDREGTVLGNWDWERVVADAGLTGKWMVLHFTDAADFERDWSMLDATQDSLREHAKLLKQRDSQINYLRAEVEALKLELHNTHVDRALAESEVEALRKDANSAETRARIKEVSAIKEWAEQQGTSVISERFRTFLIELMERRRAVLHSSLREWGA